MREALEYSELAGRELNVTYSDESTATCATPDTTAARRDLGFAPATSLLEGLAAEFEWMKETPARPLPRRYRASAVPS